LYYPTYGTPVPRIAAKLRRTQAERRAATRSRLLDATVECLFELGYSKTTTTEIAKRARVSRGAQLHHFPTKTALVTTAVDHLFSRRVEEFRAAFAQLPAAVDPARAAIDMLWAMFSGPTFYAWLELVVAARTDAALRQTVAAIAQRFIDNVQRTFRELFARSAEPGPFFSIAPALAFAMLQGLALEKILLVDEAPLTMVIEFLKRLSPLVIPPPPVGGRHA
jgi:AcrR family transcriptional regulator